MFSEPREQRPVDLDLLSLDDITAATDARTYHHGHDFEDGIHPNLKLLSHSSSILLHKCPRKYQLYKLLPSERGEHDEHTRFGQVVGVGVQAYLENGDYNRAILQAFMEWDGDIDDDRGDDAKKTFWHALFAIDKFVELKQTVLGNYDLATFQGQPATELGFSIDCGNGFSYRGFLDALLIDRMRNELVVYEGKTTKFSNVSEAVYKHSGQALGYSLIIDAIARSVVGKEVGSSYSVKVVVYKTPRSVRGWEIFDFQKSLTQRALWIKNLLIDIGHVIEYTADNYFPMHGENCFDFFRECEYFGMCELHNNSLMPKGSAVKVDADDKYPFKFKLEEIIKTQMEKFGS